MYDWVYDQALQGHITGRKVYLTGHSLGGAKATVAAARLHYDSVIPVHSLQTFGSPKVGDIDFRTILSDAGTDGTKLGNMTERFVVLGDPATTFPAGEYVPGKWTPKYIKYYHVGNTHSINPINGKSAGFEIYFDSGEIWFQPTLSQWNGFLSGAGDSEHMWYDDALYQEAINDPSLLEIKDALAEHEFVEQPDP